LAKIGIEWVKNYHGLNPNLSNTQKQAEGFYNLLSGTRSFNWGDDWAWDQDFEEKGVGSPSAGSDTIWADTVHIVFFSGHGCPQGPLFGVTNYDDGIARNTEVRWGNGTLNWIALDACQVLEQNGVFDRWRNAFAGLHIILGFHTTTSDESKRGRYFALYLEAGYTVIAAWKKACKLTEDSSTEWAYVRSGGGNGVDTYNDHWHGKGWVSPDPTNTIRYYLRGTC
jgi:hypothetical protein